MTSPSLPTCSVPLAPAVDTAADWRQQHPTWLWAALTSGSVLGTRGMDAGRTWGVELEALGALPLPDGRVVACDPYLADATNRPFTVRLPAGEHPVTVGVVRIAEDHIRPTALILVTGAGPVTRWELGVTEPAPGKPVADVDDLGFGEFHGFGVDAGCGALLSPLALADLSDVMREDDGGLDDPVSHVIEDTPNDAGVVAPRPGALAVAACHSGWGDGLYPTWIGVDDDGAPVAVVVDFLVIGDPWEKPAAPENRPRRGLFGRRPRG